ncbi:protein kinase domain-containing protein [Gemmatimonas sp.]|uniref:protein kinase domain-containing protein n=1 Tax=Gemmatimonas sp. TaxID=1962908 RepID=UPI00356477AF
MIHRDIKPENILLHDGRAMVMDFGIALAVSAAAGGRMTETGLSLGTPHYMSPEQATAERDITPRADVYSLAAALYEMLTGNPPHMGASAQQIIMKIITEVPPPVTARRKSVPANVDAALTKALEKLPADRFDTAKAFADALANPTFTTAGMSGSTTGALAGRGGLSRRLVIVMTALVALLLITTLSGWLRPAPHVAKPVTRYTLTPDSSSARSGPQVRIALSPDGARLVYTGGKRLQLFVRPRDQLQAMPLPGTAGAINPFLHLMARSSACSSATCSSSFHSRAVRRSRLRIPYFRTRGRRGDTAMRSTREPERYRSA